MVITSRLDLPRVTSLIFMIGPFGAR